MQAGNKEFSLRRFRYLFLLYAFLFSFVSTINCFLGVSTHSLVDFKLVTENDAFLTISYFRIALEFCVIACGKCIMGGVEGEFVRRSLQNQTSYMYGYYQHLDIS